MSGSLHVEFFLVAALIAASIVLAIVFFKLGSKFNLDNITKFITALNTKGGIILVLGSMSIFFFVVTIWLIFIILQDLKAGTLQQDNAVALLALQFCMNNAFSLCLGAMLKTMTGEAPANTVTTSSATSKTEPA